MMTQQDVYSYLDSVLWIGLDAAFEEYGEKITIECFLAWAGNEIPWEYGHIERLKRALIAKFGDKLIPYAEHRQSAPFNTGGRAYGEQYLRDTEYRSAEFCRQLLADLGKITA